MCIKNKTYIYIKKYTLVYVYIYALYIHKLNILKIINSQTLKTYPK
jgi:hypothetical protein